MKIILSDNYARMYNDDVVIAENVAKNHGKLIVKLLMENAKKKNKHDEYYSLEEDNYKPYRFCEY